MGRFLWWCFGITFAAVLFLGGATAFAVWHTIADTSGKTGGIMVNGVPTFVQGFQKGLNAGGGKPGTGLSSWNSNGEDLTWNGRAQAPVRRQAPATQRQRRQQAPVALKPNS